MFTVKEFEQWLKHYSNNFKQWKWKFFEEQKQIVENHLINTSETTLIFDSCFESGNLLLAVKTSESEYKLMLQTDSLTKGNTQC